MGGEARKQFSPRSREQSEREITREHHSFSRGMFSDVPGVDIPDMAEADIYNFNNYGRYLETRTGSIEWGDHSTGTPAATLPESYGPQSFFAQTDDTNSARNAYAITGTGTDIGALIQAIESDSIGWYVAIDYGSGVVYEEIVDVSGTGLNRTLYTVAVEAIGAVSLKSISIVPPIKTFFFSEFYGKFILHLGNNVYTSDDVVVSGWSRCDFYGTPYSYNSLYGSLDISASISKMVEFKERIALFTDSGIYTINVDENYFFQVNTAIPITRLEDINADPIDPEKPGSELNLYGRKRVYSYSRLTGIGNRDRLTPGVDVEWESGGCSAFPDRDYGVVWTTDEEATLSAEFIKGFSFNDASSQEGQVPSNHATHYSFYATENIHPDAGVADLGNNPEELVWEIDVPIAFSFSATIANQDGTTDLTLVDGFAPSSYENGGWVWVVAASTGVVLAQPFRISKESGVWTVSGFTGQITIGETYIYYSGGETSATYTMSGSTVTMAYGDTSSVEVGSQVFFSDGTLSYISNILSSTSFAVLNAPTQTTGSFVFDISEPPIPSSSFGSVSSTVTDNDLKNRAETYPMTGRFFEPMANGELGDIFGLFAFASSKTSQIVEYCQLNTFQEYLFGQHNKLYQYHNLGDNATHISHFKDVMAVKCLSRTVSFGTSSYTVEGNSLAGRFVFVIPYENEVSDTIGCVGPWAVTKIDGSNAEGVLTNEPGLRMFNGTSYGDNLLKDRILDKLKDIGDDFALSYSDSRGLIIWSKTYGN